MTTNIIQKTENACQVMEDTLKKVHFKLTEIEQDSVNVITPQDKIIEKAEAYSSHGYNNDSLNLVEFLTSTLSINKQIVSLLITFIIVTCGYFIIKWVKARAKTQVQSVKNVNSKVPIRRLADTATPGVSNRIEKVNMVLEVLMKLLQDLYKTRKNEGVRPDMPIRATELGLKRAITQHTGMQKVMVELLTAYIHLCSDNVIRKILNGNNDWSGLLIDNTFLRIFLNIKNNTVQVDMLSGVRIATILVEISNEYRLRYSRDPSIDLYANEIGIYLGGENHELQEQLFNYIITNINDCPTEIKYLISPNNKNLR